MDLIAHLSFGLWLYKQYGDFSAVISSIIFDLDHIIGFFYDRRKDVKIEIPKLYQFVYRKRSWFHSIAVLPILTFLFSFVCDWKIALIALTSHLLLDALDNSGIYILPYFSKKRIRGPLPPSYFIENPRKKKTKGSHLPSIVVSILFLILILLG